MTAAGGRPAAIPGRPRMPRWLAGLGWVAAALASPTAAVAQSPADGGTPSVSPGAVMDRMIAARAAGRPTSQIVMEAQPGEWPSLVSLLVSRDGVATRFCAGTVIDARAVLTSAECALASRAGDIRVELPARRHDEAPRDEIPIASVAIHPDFDAARGTNDLAVLILTRDATTIRQRLAGPETRPVSGRGGLVAVTAGFASPIAGPAMSNRPTWRVPLRESGACGTGPQRVAADPVLCAAFEPSAAAGTGEPGGPLFAETGTGEWVQVGIRSPATGSAAYVAIAGSAGWIRSIAAGANLARADDPAVFPVWSRPAAPVASLSLDVVDGPRLKIGTGLRIRLLSPRGGIPILLLQEANGKARLIWSPFVRAFRQRNGRERVSPGQLVEIPTAEQAERGARLTVTGPAGPARLVAVMADNLDRDTRDIEGLQAGDAIGDPTRLIERMLNAGKGFHGLQSHAVAVVDIEIVE